MSQKTSEISQEGPDFGKLALQPERLKLTDTVETMLTKIGEGNMGACTLILQVFGSHEPLGFMTIILMDSKKLYGERIWELWKVCGKDLNRFIYHINMELPNQGTGSLSCTGPHLADMDGEARNAHFAARKFGKPGSFWALQNPPTDPNYEYPIKVNS